MRKPGGRPKDKPPAAPAATGLSGPELEARRRSRLETTALLGPGRLPLPVLETAAAAVAVAEGAVREAQSREPPQVPSACREGCAWCCYQTVGTTVPEVLRLVEHLRHTAGAGELQALRQRVAEAEQRRRALAPGPRGRAALPCPLLVDARCVAYAARPLTCRGDNSSDAGACEAALATGRRAAVPVYAPQQRLHTLVLDGLRAGLEEVGLDGSLLELTAALGIALDVPDAGARWLRGEPVFAAARLR